MSASLGAGRTSRRRRAPLSTPSDATDTPNGRHRPRSWTVDGRFDAVVFDLGGVLIDVGGVETMRELARLDDAEQVWRRWLTCRWVRLFERGACSAQEFADGVVADWDLPIAAADFLARFESWFGAPLDGADDLVEEARAELTVACLSNTNPVHWARLSHWPAIESFDHLFLSFELGLVKPDREVFEHVTKALSTEPGRVLLLDDNTLNVDAARRSGLAALRVRGVEEARTALRAAGVLPR